MKHSTLYTLFKYLAIAGNVLFVLWILAPSGLRLLRDPPNTKSKLLFKQLFTARIWGRMGGGLLREDLH
jgi:hypothetical protein